MMDRDRMLSPAFAKRFWAKVERGSSCWLWQGRLRHGYGAVWDVSGTAGAHRVAWILTHGPIPPGLCVCHRCDNPACVNPAHLFLGTHRDNVRDMVRKGRAVNPQAERNRGKTHCRHGHPFTEENTVHLMEDGRPRRACRTCQERYSRQRAAVADTERLRYVAENPETMRFLYDMLGELWVNNETGNVRTGLLKEGHSPLDGIRQLIDECKEMDAARAAAAGRDNG